MKVFNFFKSIFNMDKTITLANGKTVDKEWYENGWDDLKGNPRWRDFKKEEPKEGQQIMCTYFKGYDQRQYEVVIYTDELACDRHITHWYPIGENL